MLSNALLMSSATVIVRSGGLFWLKPVAMVLFMLCSAALAEWLLLKLCYVEMYGMFSVIVIFFVDLKFCHIRFYTL